MFRICKIQDEMKTTLEEFDTYEKAETKLTEMVSKIGKFESIDNGIELVKKDNQIEVYTCSVNTIYTFYIIPYEEQVRKLTAIYSIENINVVDKNEIIINNPQCDEDIVIIETKTNKQDKIDEALEMIDHVTIKSETDKIPIEKESEIIKIDKQIKELLVKKAKLKTQLSNDKEHDVSKNEILLKSAIQDSKQTELELKELRKTISKLWLSNILSKLPEKFVYYTYDELIELYVNKVEKPTEEEIIKIIKSVSMLPRGKAYILLTYFDSSQSTLSEQHAPKKYTGASSITRKNRPDIDNLKGMLYKYVLGDDKIAVDLFAKAGHDDDIFAMYNIVFYSFENNFEVNIEQAIKWLERIQSKGHESAVLYLCILYEYIKKSYLLKCLHFATNFNLYNKLNKVQYATKDLISRYRTDKENGANVDKHEHENKFNYSKLCSLYNLRTKIRDYFKYHSYTVKPINFDE